MNELRCPIDGSLTFDAGADTDGLTPVRECLLCHRQWREPVLIEARATREAEIAAAVKVNRNFERNLLWLLDQMETEPCPLCEAKPWQKHVAGCSIAEKLNELFAKLRALLTPPATAEKEG